LLDGRLTLDGCVFSLNVQFIFGIENGEEPLDWQYMHLLVVEDDPQLANVVVRGLMRDGQTTDVCTDGVDAVLQAELVAYDGIVLDVMLPGQSGLEVCRQLRAKGINSPILILTARDTVEDIVAGLEAGADDYVTKPFAFR
jgi:DNA-binding response OmpR family regulator